jgi:hypothetical protein
MKRLSWIAALLVPAAFASAAGLGPTTQTLEAIHGTAVTDPARFFDGLESRVNVLEPMGYAPLPPAPEDKPAETRLESHAAATELAVREPLPPEPSTRPRGEAPRSGAVDWTTILAVGLSVALAAALLLIFL